MIPGRPPPIVRSTTFNLVGTLVPSALQLVTIPLSIGLLGNDGYGIFMLLIMLFVQFGVFDFGVGKATTHRLSISRHDDIPAQHEIVATSIVCVLVVGLIAGGLMLFFGRPLFELIGGGRQELPAGMDTALVWLALLLPLTMLGSVFGGVLEAQGRFGELSVINAGGAILSQLAPLAFAFALQATVDVFVAGVCAGRLFATLFSAALALGTLEGFRLGAARFARARDLLGYGGWLTVGSSLAPLIHSGDQLLIARLLGASAVTHYAVPFNVCQKLLLLPTALIRTLFPQLSRLDAGSARTLAEKGAIVLLCLIAMMVGPALFIVHPALEAWLSPEFAAVAALPTQVLLLGFALNGVGHVPYALLQSRGRAQTVARLYLAEILPSFVILWWLMTHFGLVGAALAWALRAGCDLVAMSLLCGFSPGFYCRVAVVMGALAALFTTNLALSPVVASGLPEPGLSVAPGAVPVALQLLAFPTLALIACAGIALAVSPDLRAAFNRQALSGFQRLSARRSP